MLRIALLGIGNVGRAFARYLLNTSETTPCAIMAAADISGGAFLEFPGQLRSLLGKLDQGALVKEAAASGPILAVEEYLQSLPAAGIQVLVECMPTNIVDGQPALGYLHRVIQLGIPAVTVDKGVMVHGFGLLTEAARKAGVEIAYTGTTGVRPPEDITGRKIREIRGILNGTTNFILTQMLERSIAFADALADARRQGVAEPNPALDTEGWDTACKILILANRWLGADTALEQAARVGIGAHTEALIRTARASGRVVRLVGRARAIEGRVQISVAPELIDADSPFFSISGTSKGALFITDAGEEFFAESRSGLDAIAQTILEDVRSVTRGVES